MDDLMNKVGALIEEHVKAEVASHRVFDESECETRLVALFGVTDPRDIVESVERAVKERDKAKEQLKELIALLGLDGVSPETVKGALLKVRAWDKDLREKRDNACAQRDEAVRHAQALREQVQALELKLLEVRKVVADEARAPDEVDGFRVGDLVRHRSSTLSWGVVDAVGQYIRVVYPGHDRGPGAPSYKPDEITRKPVEVGDAVRVTLERYASRTGTVKSLGQDGKCDLVCESPSTMLYVRHEHLVAIAP